MWGDVEPAQHVRELVLGQTRDRRYLVYSLYHLMAWDSPALPVNPALLG